MTAEARVVVEAVGIEQDSIHPVPTILQGFSRTNRVGRSAQECSENALAGELGTRVPTREKILAQLRRVRVAVDEVIALFKALRGKDRL
ncbi:MAG: hypothetical protein JRE45_17810 [Deltaproteobacteria bacterium]|jgi:hypothetical protein|nr:hypothetical protein [Deltaproteobacteria bacterium]MBW2159863.1 hypothetical protein [Deltaproteobacteria bacterium]MBW2629454.1 hypothetical protein [Deltaproteobacteria bacterium]MBW2686345.1 hypothetical protein [Deltaproteobacteria bacterium]